MGLRQDLIRLAATNTEVRPHILPLLKEAKGVSEEAIAQIENLVRDNHHTEAVKALAVALGRLTDAKVLDLVIKIQNLYGQTPVELMQFRSAIAGMLVRNAESKMDAELYKRLRKAL